MEDQIITVIKKVAEENIKETVEQQINEEVERFRQKLEDSKEQYISEIMKGIRICHQREEGCFAMNYKIVFENVWRIENENTKDNIQRAKYL